MSLKSKGLSLITLCKSKRIRPPFIFLTIMLTFVIKKNDCPLGTCQCSYDFGTVSLFIRYLTKYKQNLLKVLAGATPL